MTFEIKRGDTAPSFDQRLSNDDGEPVDISNYQLVEFNMRDDNYNTIVSDDTTGSVSVDNAVSGDVSYQWQSGDTDDIGHYKAEFVVTFSDGRIRSFPHGRDHYDIDVVEDIQ